MPLFGRTVGHWTPVYIRDRLRWWHYERTHPDHPWLTPEANRLLASILRPTDRGVEWGSGRSTRWLAQRIAHLTSIETDPEWYARVKETLLGEGLRAKVDYRLLPTPPGDVPPDPWQSLFQELRRQSLDFVLVDGAYRDHCALCAVDILDVGGVLVIDNINRYLPSQSRAPGSIPLTGAPQSPGWKEFVERVREWRCVWTSQGITDTAIWFRGK